MSIIGCLIWFVLFIIACMAFNAIFCKDDISKREPYDPYFGGGLLNPYDGPHGPCFRDVGRYKKN